MKNNGMKGFIKGFGYAFSGIMLMLKERNIRVHLAVALNVLTMSPFLGVNRIEYAVLILVCALVISLEGVNTAIEKLSDRITKEADKDIKNVKDISAGFVLIAAVFSVIIGIVIMFRPAEIINLLSVIFTNPLYTIGFIATELILLFFILSSKKE